jgi:hypothetical protein
MEDEKFENEVMLGRRKIKYTIASPESVFLADGVMETRLDFRGKAHLLWQLESYIARLAEPLINAENDDPGKLEEIKVAFMNFLFLPEAWARGRNLSCRVKIRGWRWKSILCRIIKFSYKIDDFIGLNKPAT